MSSSLKWHTIQWYYSRIFQERSIQVWMATRETQVDTIFRAFLTKRNLLDRLWLWIKKYVYRFYYLFPTYPTVSSNFFNQELISTYTSPNQTNYLPDLIKMLDKSVYTWPVLDFTKFYFNQNNSIKVFLFLYDYLATTSSATSAFKVKQVKCGIETR